jgi:hypothetical protein
MSAKQIGPINALTGMVNRIETQSAAMAAERESNPELAEVQAQLTADWQARGFPALELLKELSRTPRFKAAQKLYRFDWQPHIRAGVPHGLVGRVDKLVNSIFSFYPVAISQLGEIPRKIARLVPSDVRKSPYGDRWSDTITKEMSGVLSAASDIDQWLTMLEASLTKMENSPKSAVRMLRIAGVGSPAQSSNPREAETSFDV